MQPFYHLDLQAVPAKQMLARLNPLDWALLLTIAVSTVAAFVRGLIRSSIALGGVIAGIVMAAWYTADVAQWLRRWVPEPTLAEVLAFVAILSGCYLLAAMLGRVLRGACTAVGLGFFDRLGGAAFGMTRAVLVLSALLVPAAPYLVLLPFTRDSLLLPYLRTAAHGISFVLPRDFAERLPPAAGFWKPPASGKRHRSAIASPQSLPEPGTAEGDAQ